jgi:hypothetical protein
LDGPLQRGTTNTRRQLNESGLQAAFFTPQEDNHSHLQSALQSVNWNHSYIQPEFPHEVDARPDRRRNP